MQLDCDFLGNEEENMREQRLTLYKCIERGIRVGPIPIPKPPSASTDFMSQPLIHFPTREVVP